MIPERQESFRLSNFFNRFVQPGMRQQHRHVEEGQNNAGPDLQADAPPDQFARQDSEETQQNEQHGEKKDSGGFSIFKIGKEILKIGVIIGAAFAFGPMGAMVASGGVTALDQLATKGKVDDWGAIGINTVLAGLPLRAGSLVMKHLGSKMSSMTAKLALAGAVDGGIFGFLSGSAYSVKNQIQEGKGVDLGKAVESGTSSIATGAIGGAVLGPAMHKLINKMPLLRRLAHKDPFTKSSKKSPSVKKPSSQARPKTAASTDKRTARQGKKTKIARGTAPVSKEQSSATNSTSTKPSQPSNQPSGVLGKDFSVKNSFSSKGLLKPPTKISASVKWARELRAHANHLKQLAGGNTKIIQQIDDFVLRQVSRLESSASRLTQRLNSSQLKTSDLASGSVFRKEISALKRSMKQLGVKDFDARFPELFLIHHSRPRFVASGNQGNALGRGSPDPASKLIQRLEGTGRSFESQVQRAVEQLPGSVQRQLRRFGFKFVSKQYGSQGMQGSMSVRGYQSGQNLDYTRGTSLLGRRELFVNEWFRNSQTGQWMRSMTTRGNLTHEAGHGADRIMYFLKQLRKLNKAGSVQEYQKLVQRLGQRTRQLSQMDSHMISHSKRFEQAYLRDVASLKGRRLNEDFSYYLRRDANGRTTHGQEETFAEGFNNLLGQRSQVVNDAYFPNVMREMRRMLGKYFKLPFNQTSPTLAATNQSTNTTYHTVLAA